MATTRIRLNQVLPADAPDDQKLPADILLARTPAITSEEDVENLYLSRLREILFGPPGSGPVRHWYDDLQTLGLKSLATLSASSLDETRHAALRQLTHLADTGGPKEGWASGAVRDTLPSGSPFPTEITWWTDATRTKKILVKNLVLNGQRLPTRITWTAYASDGTTALAQVRDDITYTSVFEVSRTRTVT